MFPVSFVAFTLFAVLAAGVAWTLRRHEGASALLPTPATVGTYLGLLVVAYLSMTGLRRFQAVELLSYVLNAPWYALAPLIEYRGDVLTLMPLVWTLVALFLTLAYLYVLAAALVAAGHRASARWGS